MRRVPVGELPICIPKPPSPDKWKELAREAKAIRADNVPEGVDIDDIDTTRGGRLALVIRLRWPKTGVRLTVGFLDNPAPELRRKVLAYANRWGRTANVGFVETRAAARDADVRLTRVAGAGHWSWIGIDIRNHPGEATLNIDGLTLRTDDSEVERSVCHEFGHTLGFEHEHLRGEIMRRLDREKTIAYFMRTQGWTRKDVIYQVLTPLERDSILGTTRADEDSIMCYQIPGACTKDGAPILGGRVISRSDYEFAARVYPKGRPG